MELRGGSHQVSRRSSSYDDECPSCPLHARPFAVVRARRTRVPEMSPTPWSWCPSPESSGSRGGVKCEWQGGVPFPPRSYANVGPASGFRHSVGSTMPIWTSARGFVPCRSIYPAHLLSDAAAAAHAGVTSPFPCGAREPLPLSSTRVGLPGHSPLPCRPCPPSPAEAKPGPDPLTGAPWAPGLISRAAVEGGDPRRLLGSPGGSSRGSEEGGRDLARPTPFSCASKIFDWYPSATPHGRRVHPQGTAIRSALSLVISC